MATRRTPRASMSAPMCRSNSSLHMTFTGTDFENGGGYPTTFNDGVHGTFNLISVIQVTNNASNTVFINPGFEGCYLWDKGTRTRAWPYQLVWPDYDTDGQAAGDRPEHRGAIHPHRRRDEYRPFRPPADRRRQHLRLGPGRRAADHPAEGHLYGERLGGAERADQPRLADAHPGCRPRAAPSTAASRPATRPATSAPTSASASIAAPATPSSCASIKTAGPASRSPACRRTPS